jgi:signal transduction histidine kinase
MSLTGRFSALFLAALALALAGFSASIYVAARFHLESRVAERVDAALDILAAAAEIHPDGVEWEPGERFLPLGAGDGPDQLRWIIHDDRGRRVDRSINLAESELTADWAPRPKSGPDESRLTDRLGRTWLVARRRIFPGRTARTGSQAAAVTREPPAMDPPVLFFPTLDLMACASLEPTASTLASLAWFLIALNSGVWVLAALLCRRLSRHALAPLRRLAESARGLGAADPGWCLEEAGTGDELDELGRAFNDLLARLHRAYQHQRAFSGAASHQLRTPLTSLIGQIEVALRRERTAEEYRHALGAALPRAVQLGRVIESLLYLSQNEFDPQLPDAEPLDLDRWSRDQVADLLESGRFDRFVRIETADRPLPVKADPILLNQLLDNLLDNARKHAGPASPIVVKTMREDRSAVLVVEDSGPGIVPEDAERIFEPFYRSAQARRRGIPGAGLGLAIVQRIATALGGTAEVRHGAAGGCRIEIRIPIDVDCRPAAAPLAASGRSS